MRATAMESQSLQEKIGKTAFVSLKLIPGLKEVLEYIENLNKIWMEDPAAYQKQIEYEAALFKNIEAMVKQSSSGIVDNFTARLSEVEKEFAELRVTVRLTQRNNIVITRHAISQILNYAITPATPTFADLTFAAANLSDCEFKILIACYGGEFPWHRDGNWTFSAEDCRRSILSEVHPREVSFSLARLSDFGFFERQPEQGEWDAWESRVYRPALPDIEKFAEAINALPVTAILPMAFSVLDIEKKIDPKEVERVRQIFLGMDKHRLKVFTVTNLASAIRRHPFKGYQWKVVTSKPEGDSLTFEGTEWQGKNWEYSSIASAMDAANLTLLKDGQPTDWINVAV